MENYLDIFYTGLEKLNIRLSEGQIQQFIKYYNILVETNKVMNLTAITAPKEVIEKHFIDSLSIVKAVDINKNINVIDIGTGAGFPGIPLKISYPQLRITLLDSLNKRIGFLNDVIKLLKLENIETIHGRSEEYGKNKKYREQYDLCVSRAVANLSILSEYCIPFVKIGGKFVAYKSGRCREEVNQAENAVDKLGGKVGKIVDFCIDNTDISRSLVVIDKVMATKTAYPRKAGIPSKEPLV
ncbi:MAG: 16S rRNA (guanine(527)-N(7))-methyltransferase RsmG [Lachnospiraceae bacterium]